MKWMVMPFVVFLKWEELDSTRMREVQRRLRVVFLELFMEYMGFVVTLYNFWMSGIFMSNKQILKLKRITRFRFTLSLPAVRSWIIYLTFWIYEMGECHRSVGWSKQNQEPLCEVLVPGGSPVPGKQVNWWMVEISCSFPTQVSPTHTPRLPTHSTYVRRLPEEKQSGRDLVLSPPA